MAMGLPVDGSLEVNEFSLHWPSNKQSVHALAMNHELGSEESISLSREEEAAQSPRAQTAPSL